MHINIQIHVDFRFYKVHLNAAWSPCPCLSVSNSDTDGSLKRLLVTPRVVDIF